MVERSGFIPLTDWFEDSLTCSAMPDPVETMVRTGATVSEVGTKATESRSPSFGGLEHRRSRPIGLTHHSRCPAREFTFGFPQVAIHVEENP